jgi:uncharacterized membrane protein
MSITRLIILIIGIVLAVYGLFAILNGGFDLIRLAVGALILLIGVYLISGRGITL